MPKFDPLPWQPLPAPPLVGPLGENEDLAKATLWLTPAGGPEDVIVDSDGSAITGLADGRVIRVTSQGTIEDIAHLGARPLGIEWLGDGEMIVCATANGLMRVTVSGETSTIVDAFEGVALGFVNNASVALDGTIYFSDTSTRWQLDEYVNDLLEGRPTGRVFRRTTDGTISVVADNLQFANGVALDGGEASLFIAETGKYRVHRLWLKGERAGEIDLFLDNLAGYPDNLTFSDGILWVAMASPRQGLIDFVLPRPWIKRLSHKMPDSLKPRPVRHGMILGYNMSGGLVHNLQDSSGEVAITTSARVHDGRLFVGSLSEPHVAVYEL